MSKTCSWRAQRRGAAVGALLAALLAPGLQEAQAASREAYIVILKPDVAARHQAAGQVKAAKGVLGSVFGSVVNGYSAKMTPSAAKKLANAAGVAVVAKDGPVRLVGEPVTQPVQSSYQPSIWGLDRIDEHQRLLDGNYHYTYTGKVVRAFVLDTGVQATHTEFGTRVATGFDAFGQGQQRQDCHGHGTHVAGTIGGRTYGVAKEVTIVPVRVLRCDGTAAWSDIIKGIDWVTAQAPGGPAVANMSIGGGTNSAVDEAVRRSIKRGVTYALAAGNGNILGTAIDACKASPSRVTEAITVGATDSTDKKASFSNYGSCVDVFAPGVGVVSAAPRVTKSGPIDNGAWAPMSGTSMASPHAAGMAAVFLEAAVAVQAAPTPAQVSRAVAALATRSVVTSSKTTAPLLLYSPPTTLTAAQVTTLMAPVTTAPPPPSTGLLGGLFG